MWPVVAIRVRSGVFHPAQTMVGYPTILLRIGCASLVRRYSTIESLPRLRERRPQVDSVWIESYVPPCLYGGIGSFWQPILPNRRAGLMRAKLAFLRIKVPVVSGGYL